ncbi:hypothetical protein FB45DRAFT_946844 [Roridomyces roridus]|uniref:Uncharacterized protein n=1 Tax=Roridomyces roridus TaxID=1738132 RepID=A0AAD7F856_9AGAR|nr:hypothetical protein FB45DRAFT_946844 [Roridomyces roridus]
MSPPIQEYRAPCRVLTACAQCLDNPSLRLPIHAINSTSRTRQRLSAERLYVAGGKEEIRHSGVSVPSVARRSCAQRRGGPEREERRENSVVPMMLAQTRCSPTCTDLRSSYQCHRAPTVIASRTACGAASSLAGCEIGERGREDANQSVVHAIEDTRDMAGRLGSQAEGHGG